MPNPTPDRYTSNIHYQMSPSAALYFIALLPDLASPDGRVHYTGDATAESPRILPSRDAENEEGLVPGSLVLDIGGAPWYAKADGTTVQLADLDGIGVLSDMPLDTSTVVENITSLHDRIGAIEADKTDYRIPVSLNDRFDAAGTWTLTRQGAGQYRLRRTAAASPESAFFVVSPEQRTTASMGFRATGFRMAYVISTADLNDVTVAAVTAGMPANGSAVAAGTSLGAVTYDASHDTPAERKAQGNHTMSGTFATPIFLNAGQQVEIQVAADGTASGVLDINKLELLGTWVDGASA